LNNSMMVAFREENKLAFFLPERVARMDPMPWHGSSRSAGALFDLKEHKTLCVLCVSVVNFVFTSVSVCVGLRLSIEEVYNGSW
jgi:hypothetical protein